MKTTSKRMVGRVVIVALAVLVQVVWLVFMIMVLGDRFPIVTTVIDILSIVAVLRLTSKNINPAYKLAWTTLILVVPIVGAVIYLLFGRSWMGKDMQHKLDESYHAAADYLSGDRKVTEHLRRESETAARQSCYISGMAGFPLYQGTKTKYYRVGEEMYRDLLTELKRAGHFIFMEYFIIAEGEMWDSILAVLEEKAQMGLDVRLIYDDFGCASRLPQQLQLQLQRKGIRCEVFNPLMPVASIILNNRDHRKITVIDGYVAFTGGVNLADEYINAIQRFGYWKDSAVMLRGEAVWSFTVMFLQMWSVLAHETVDFAKYRPHVWHEEPFETDGFVQPYGDTPLDHETVGESVYLNIINRAKRYIYIFTPYLVIDSEVTTALCLAAKSGIDVRIVVPGIPDKKLVFLVTQSHYGVLLEAGVRIYEYSRGFLHAKSFVCDDKIATVGSINLDYRSLYLHFECGVWMYHAQAVLQLKKDVLETFRESREITLENCRRSALTQVWQSVLRLFAPLM